MTSRHKLIAFSMITLGILLAVVGFTSGGKWVIVKGDNGFSVPSNNGLEKNSHTLEAFSDIHVINNYGDVEILQGDSYTLETNVVKNTDVSYSMDNGTLTVETKSKGKNGVTFGIGTFKTPSIIITVPKDAKLNSVIVDSDFGDTMLQGLHYQQLSIKGDYGDILLQNITSDKTEITQAFGDLTLEQFISNGFVVESEHGEIDIEGTLNGQSQITSNFGDTTLDLQNKKSELGFELKTSFGEITVNDREHNSKASQPLEGHNQLNASLSHGDLELSLN
ncbi:DUF4097 family beta strand repeat-containing protein [Lysinibacillus varians]|uniref:DUF4097 domain-containing protein n=1 Tax=Lysinibacillus varians TaxID=1145276 RepID=A0ABY2TI79_9BACI|nr:DUF4097 family beta strand repeat-containing protein [Lysinibacillus varians]AHN21326.1 hypothetical protein T479_07610 [Lysinibacillus varians]TKI67100.1 DUF4097 domain-containing protein [Lysinibacillus varians]